MARQHAGDEPRFVGRQAVSGEEERDLGLRFARPFLDLQHLARDLGLEELALALAADYSPAAMEKTPARAAAAPATRMGKEASVAPATVATTVRMETSPS